MNVSKNYEKVKNYYDKGLWDKNKVYRAVGKWITEGEYTKIIGESYKTDGEEESEQIVEEAAE